MTLLFDLDGTLTDSSAGICRSVNHALVVLGREARSEPEIRALVGTPLAAIFGDLFAGSMADLAAWILGPPADADHAGSPR